MFNNLKSKVIKENSYIKDNEINQLSVKNDDLSLARTQSIESLNSTTASETKSKKKDETIKKWESKVSNLVCSVREKNAIIKELESRIQNDKNEFDRRLSELKESSALNVQSLLDDHRTQLQELEQDREHLRKKLLDTQNQLDSMRTQCFSLGEERENIDDLTKQELAKVKHLLLLRDSDFDKLEIQNDELHKNLEKLEILNKGLKYDVDKKQSDLSRIIKEREVDSEERRSQQTTIRGLLTDKENLEVKHEECKEKLAKMETMLMNVERSSADLYSKLQQITRDHDQLKIRHSRLETEKSDRESDLKDRIRSLENHLALVRETENVDDRVKLLEDKCFQLEAKCMEEKQMKDNLVKCWSARVDSLEVQISNLNSKIAEDAEEIANYNQVKSRIREDCEKMITDLKKDLVEREREILSLQKEIDESAGLRNEEENKWRILEDKLHSECHQKVIECNSVSQENIALKKDLIKLQDQHNSLVIEHRSKNATMLKIQEDMTKLKAELEEKSDEISSLTGERFKRELKLTELNSQVACLESAKADFIKSAASTDSDFKSIQIQIKRLNEEKILLSKKLDTVNEQYHTIKRECDHRIKTMQLEVESRTRELDVAHADIKDLQDQMKEIDSESGTILVNIENSEVLQLKNEIEVLNCQLSEKNNIIRNQKQKMSDLKKTLSREIKFNNTMPKTQSNDNDSLDSRNNYAANVTSSSDPMYDNSRVLTGPTADVGSSSGDDGPVVIDRNGHVIMDQINFKYLKHVIVKFLLSKESEAIQLIKAVSTLLRLTKLEETQIKETLEHRRSWFNSLSSKSSKGIQDQQKKSRMKRVSHAQ